MSIQCVIRSLGGLEEGKQTKYADVVNAAAIGGDDFVDAVCRNRNLERAQVKAVLSGVSETLAEYLSLGHVVRVDGIGSFSVDVKGRLEEDKRGVLQLKDAHVKTVKIKPSADLIKELGECSFTLLSHNAFTRRTMDSDAAKETVLRLLEEKPFFTCNDFQRETGTSKSYALKLLTQLKEDGSVRQTRYGRGYIWTKAE